MIIKTRNGFTLIEIFVVLIILGVIAVFAFPGIFAQIERHRGQEALNTLNLIKSNIESCGLQNRYNFALCSNWDVIGMTSPTTANFKYDSDAVATDIRVGATAFAQDVYSVQAKRTTSTDTITITRANTGIVTCAGTGAFAGFC